MNMTLHLGGPLAAGPMGGMMESSNHVMVQYSGVWFGTQTLVGGSATASNFTTGPGLAVAGTVGLPFGGTFQVGYTFGSGGFWEAGVGTPGISMSVYYGEIVGR